MAVKDFDLTEDSDQKATSSGNNESTGRVPSKKENEKHEASIKNAHASGDGSYGRNDESLPEEDRDRSKDKESY